MTTSNKVGPLEFADNFIDSYNSGDLDRITALLSEDVRFVHHNRGVDVQGKDAARKLLETYGELFPGKAFSNRRSIATSGDRVFVEHTWGGKAMADVPGWAAAGETVSLDLGTFMTVRDGLLVEYHDYG
ncbi:nuclear transport factor 2 family protein [Saccharopolyspora sp. ASAGF58]|uniref:nuclear transport factor 2 family protein n=1 Tax=Saccharopolyspora sp. ASAGF58 TaxID=2719023 RepID=UPI0014402690|nr:nuclear transport factor 2 family protein [Saccharopolyspora sp. ASAGF58]QIZ37742.1 nuclear transport factor 2 family protein [Saccharopolyspora sp. ASAGF58]